MNTIQNKGILWKLLQENGYFNNIIINILIKYKTILNLLLTQ